jgi:hypothetical protein
VVVTPLHVLLHGDRSGDQVDVLAPAQGWARDG